MYVLATIKESFHHPLHSRLYNNISSVNTLNLTDTSNTKTSQTWVPSLQA
jgi:hypothetical protein